MKKDLISILVVLKNTEDDIKKCLDSILKQTYSNLEVLVLMEENFDKIEKVVSKIIKKDDRVKAIYKNNRTKYSSKVNGYKKAKGKFILYVNASDFLEKNMVEVMYNNLILEDVDIVHCQHKYYHNGVIETPKNILNRNVKMNLLELEPQFFDLLYKTSNCDFITRQLIRKSIMNNIVEVDLELTYFDELALNLKIYKEMSSILFIPDELYIYHTKKKYSQKTQLLELQKEIDDMIYCYYNLYQSVSEFKIKDQKRYKKLASTRFLVILVSLFYKLRKLKKMNKKSFNIYVNEVMENKKVKEIVKFIQNNDDILESVKQNEKFSYKCISLLLQNKIKPLYYFYKIFHYDNNKIPDIK